MRLESVVGLGLATLCASCAPPDDGPGELLWDVQKSGATTASLFGTVHTRGLGDARTYHPSALAAFDTSSVVIVEADLSQVDIPEYTRLALLEDGVPGLDTQLTPEAWQQLTLATKSIVQVEVLTRAQPWYALQLFTKASVYQWLADDGSPVVPMDLALAAEARARGADVRFLETWQEQISLLQATSGVAELEAALAVGGPELNKQKNALEFAWLSGDVKGIEAQLGQTKAEQLRVLLDERNLRWAAVLGDVLASERQVFVGVGSAHLLRGEKGLPALLRKKGLVVSRHPSGQ